ncbi:MAG: MerR family transcriptional regulator [Mycobacteriales bacterium]
MPLPGEALAASSQDFRAADPEQPGPPQPRYAVSAVAHRLGVAPATLRTWARRYGLGPSLHVAGSHRRYSAADVARLEVMQRLSRDGVPPADAARVALGTPDATEPVTPVGPRSPGGPGGRVLAVGSGNPTARGLGRAAMALDAAAMTRLIRRAIEDSGVMATWDGLLRPVLAAAGERWATTGEGIDVEHLLSDCTVGVLREVTANAPAPRNARPVLLAAAPAEQHAVPLFALAAGLAEIGVGCHQLGAAVPDEALHSAVRRIGPAVLFVWSQLAATADPGALATLPVTRPPTVVLVGGPGWSSTTLPDRVTVAESLAAAVQFVADAVGAVVPA